MFFAFKLFGIATFASLGFFAVIDSRELHLPVPITHVEDEVLAWSAGQKWIAWCETQPNGKDIYLFNVQKQTRQKIAENLADEVQPVISGHFVLWDKAGKGRNGIGIYNIATGLTLHISLEGFDLSNPVASDNYLACRSQDQVKHQNHHILLYKFGESSAKRISTSSEVSFDMALGKIAWTSYSGRSMDVYLMNLENGKIKRLTSTRHDEDKPIFHSGDILWEYFDGRDKELVIYNLENGIGISLTDNTKDDTQAKLGRECIAWLADDGHDNDVFMYNRINGETLQLSANSTEDMSLCMNDEYLCWLTETTPYQRVNIYHLHSGVKRQLPDYHLQNAKLRLLHEGLVWQSTTGDDQRIFWHPLQH